MIQLLTKSVILALFGSIHNFMICSKILYFLTMLKGLWQCVLNLSCYRTVVGLEYTDKTLKSTWKTIQQHKPHTAITYTFELHEWFSLFIALLSVFCQAERPRALPSALYMLQWSHNVHCTLYATTVTQCTSCKVT
jgi:hypothetical protein